jgi:orotate phosphoribosyltransferase
MLVEDMSSTFMSCLKAMKPLEQAGARVTNTVLINTWNLPAFRHNIEGHEVHALCTGEMILSREVELGKVDKDHEKIVLHWLKHPEDESWAQDGTWLPPKGETF